MMEHLKKIIVLLVLFWVPIFIYADSPDSVLVGVKTYEKHDSLSSVFETWDRLGINAVFASLELNKDKEFRRLAKKYNMKRFVILPIFYNSDTLSKNNDLYAITKSGEKASQDWVKFVCPSRKNYRKDKITSIKNIVEETSPDGISIDFIRHFVYWEKVYPDDNPETITNTCFCDTCMKYFQKDVDVSIPQRIREPQKRYNWIQENHYSKWVDWKCSLITSMVKEITKESKNIKPDIHVNIHTLPWRQDDFGGALKKVAGQDINELSNYSDYISPMTYSHMLKRPPEWIRKVLTDYSDKSTSKLIPSIQVSKSYLDNELTVNEFKKMLKSATSQNSAGVVLWSWEALSDSQKKKNILKNYFR